MSFGFQRGEKCRKAVILKIFPQSDATDSGTVFSLVAVSGVNVLLFLMVERPVSDEAPGWHIGVPLLEKVAGG